MIFEAACYDLDARVVGFHWLVFIDLVFTDWSSLRVVFVIVESLVDLLGEFLEYVVDFSLELGVFDVKQASGRGVARREGAFFDLGVVEVLQILKKADGGEGLFDGGVLGGVDEAHGFVDIERDVRDDKFCILVGGEKLGEIVF